MVYSENTRLNNQSLLETEYHQYESKYNNKGGLSLIYKIDLKKGDYKKEHQCLFKAIWAL